MARMMLLAGYSRFASVRLNTAHPAGSKEFAPTGQNLDTVASNDCLQAGDQPLHYLTFARHHFPVIYG